MQRKNRFWSTFALVPLLLTVFLAGCADPTSTITDSGTTDGYSIGDVGPAGGWIFYIDTDNEFDWTYLEVAPGDAAESSRWTDATGATVDWVESIPVGRGLQNTLDIVDQEGHTNSAAQAALDYSAGGFDDWFLPSRSELMRVRDNLHNNGIGNFESDIHWSSSEAGTGGNQAWFINFANDAGWGSTAKTSSQRVRAIRSF